MLLLCIIPESIMCVLIYFTVGGPLSLAFQAILELGSNNAPASASQVAGTTGAPPACQAVLILNINYGDI